MEAQQPNHPAEPPASPMPPAPPMPLEGTEWRLTDYLGPAGALVPVAGDIMATATFDGGAVAGSTGCNRYHGTYVADGDALSVGPLAMTMMACEPERTAVERAFTGGLAAAVAYAIDGGTLVLTGADGRVVLRFRAATALPLVGTRWIATGINNGRGGVVSAFEGAEVSAVFGPDGRVTGSGGCNRCRWPVRDRRRVARDRPAGDHEEGLPGARGGRRAGVRLLRGARPGRDLVDPRGPARAPRRGRRPPGGIPRGRRRVTNRLRAGWPRRRVAAVRGRSRR